MIALHSWYRPKLAFELDGRRWHSDNYVAIALPATGDVRNIDCSSAIVDMVSASASRPALTAERHANGHVMIGVGAFQGHQIDLCESAFTGLVWRAPGGALDPAVGYVDGRAVALVMPMRRTDGACKAPDCVECNGTGEGAAEECEECDGQGTYECNLGHEHGCEACYGSGETRPAPCPECGGSGEWRAPEAIATERARVTR